MNIIKMVRAECFLWALAAIGLCGAQEASTEVDTSVSIAEDPDAVCIGRDGQCKACKHGTPKSFPFCPCPVKTVLAGSLKLGGSVSGGRIDLRIRASLQNNCGGSEPCQRAKLSFEEFTVEQIHYWKNHVHVKQKYPPVSPGCSTCDVMLTYGKPKPKPPTPPPVTCDIAADIIAAVDVSKSMSTPKKNPDATIDLVQQLSLRFKIRKEKARFGLTAFGDDARIRWSLQDPRSTSAKGVYLGIGELSFGNHFSNHASAIDSAIDQFEKGPRRKVPNLFVLFADGKPNKDVGRLKHAIKRLRCQPHLCFAVVGINTLENSEEEAFYRWLLGCGKKGKCKELFLIKPTVDGEIDKTVDGLTEFLCDCCKKAPTVAEPEAVTTFTIRIADTTLTDFGTRDELNQTVDTMLFSAAEATGVTPDRLRAIAIEDTLGNVVGGDSQGSYPRRLGQAESGPVATLIEVLFQEPGLNIEPKSQETVRRLAQMLQSQSTLKERFAQSGIVNAEIERIAIRQNDGSMPIVDILKI